MRAESTSEPRARPKLLRLALLTLAALLAVCLLLFGIAWALMPRDWIQQEAKRQAARMSQATVRWQRLTPGFQHWALGVTIRNLELRMPDQGPVRLQARIPEAFVSFRLLPLFFRRVEIDGAHIHGGGIVMTDRGPSPPSPEEPRAKRYHMYLPRVDLKDVSVRTRDPLGSGYDLKRISGSARITGSLEEPRALRLDVTAESLYWKPEGRSPLLPLPSPVDVGLALDSRDGGKRLVVTEGKVLLGPLVSAIVGEVQIPGGKAPAQLALRATGGPQTIRSSDPALRGLSGKSPASWSATSTWDVRFGGTTRDMSNQGRLVLKSLSVSAQSNTFTMEQASVSWTSTAERTFVGRAEGFGGGVTFTAEARGVTRPGGSIEGTFYARAPAERLNGLLANGPNWSSGDLECRGTFLSHPPAQFAMEYTVTGSGFSGMVPGIARPIRRLNFNVTGNQAAANINTLDAVVGSTSASVTGQVKLGAAVRSGNFDVRLDRLVADEWTQGPAGARLSSSSGSESSASLPVSNFVASMHIGEVRNRGLVVHDVTVPVRFAGGKLVADPIQGSIGGGSVRGALDVSGIGSTPSYTLHLDLKQVPVDEVASGLLPVRLPLSGTLNEVVDLRGVGFPGPETAGTMHGTVSGTLERGLILQSPALKTLRATLGASSPAEVPFQTIVHSARIDAGKMLLDKVSGDMGRDLFEMTGALGFDQSLDLSALLRLAPSRVSGGGFLAQIANYAKDSEGRIPVQVRITGSALSPKVSVKPGQLLQSVGTQFLKEQLKGFMPKRGADSARRADSLGARGDTTRRTSGILRRMLGKTATDSTRAARRDSSAKQDSVENPLKKAFERLLGK